MRKVAEERNFILDVDCNCLIFLQVCFLRDWLSNKVNLWESPLLVERQLVLLTCWIFLHVTSHHRKCFRLHDFLTSFTFGWAHLSTVALEGHILDFNWSVFFGVCDMDRPGKYRVRRHTYPWKRCRKKITTRIIEASKRKLPALVKVAANKRWLLQQESFSVNQESNLMEFACFTVRCGCRHGNCTTALISKKGIDTLSVTGRVLNPAVDTELVV